MKKKSYAPVPLMALVCSTGAFLVILIGIVSTARKYQCVNLQTKDTEIVYDLDRKNVPGDTISVSAPHGGTEKAIILKLIQ
jgi:hypothetical protein